MARPPGGHLLAPEPALAFEAGGYQLQLPTSPPNFQGHHEEHKTSKVLLSLQLGHLAHSARNQSRHRMWASPWLSGCCILANRGSDLRLSSVGPLLKGTPTSLESVKVMPGLWATAILVFICFIILITA